jgi:hypothetical protein
LLCRLSYRGSSLSSSYMQILSPASSFQTSSIYVVMQFR